MVFAGDAGRHPNGRLSGDDEGHTGDYVTYL